MSEVTRILSNIEAGDPSSIDQLLPLVYAQLKQMAAIKMAAERKNHTLQTTALVHEAYIRLVDVAELKSWRGRKHFFAAAAEAMRRILIERARRNQRRQATLQECRLLHTEGSEQESLQGVDILALDEALEELGTLHPRQAELVKLRFFAGMTLTEAAQVLEISESTADRDWKVARARLGRLLLDFPRPAGP